jgi:hypothetical protein
MTKPFGDVCLGVATEGFRTRAALVRRVRKRFAFIAGLADLQSNRDLPPDFDDLITGKPEEIRHVGSVALHSDKYRFLPMRQPFSVGAGRHGLMTYIVGNVSKIDRTAARLELLEHVRHIGPLHESVANDNTPEASTYLCERNALVIGYPWNRFGDSGQRDDVLM